MGTEMEAQQSHPCTPLASLLGTLFARAASAACGSEWQVEPAAPPPDLLPALGTPAHYRLRFQEGLRGGCYLVMEQASLGSFLAKGAEPASAALLGLLEEIVGGLAEAILPSHGATVIEVEAANALVDASAEHALVLEARGAAGLAATLLLYFDEELVQSWAAKTDGFAEAGSGHVTGGAANLDLVMDVELNCTLRFGQRQLSLREILDLASGSVVELDRQVDEPVELILDGKVIARGEAVLIDGNYGLRVTQVLQPVVY